MCEPPGVDAGRRDCAREAREDAGGRLRAPLHSPALGHDPFQLVPVRRALISVSDKTDLIPFAAALIERGVEILSTGGTALALEDAGIPTTAVESVTGFPEIMAGRIKTLHPLIHGGLLARRDDAGDRRAMERHGIRAIDLVCVSLYPFQETARRTPAPEPDEIIEQIDIGGPAMIRSAAKNAAWVTVVTSRDQYRGVIDELAKHGGATTGELRRRLAGDAFARTAAYDAAIASWMSTSASSDSGGVSGAELPARLTLSMPRLRSLRYGENPHQRAALYRDEAQDDGVAGAMTVGEGRELSYNNLLDAEAALELVDDLERIQPGRTAAAIIKHTSACGACCAADAAEAFAAAWEGDPVAAYGGILALGRPIDEAAARRIAAGGQTFLEVIVAPRFELGAARILAARWKNVRLLAVGDRPAKGLQGGLRYRSIPGGMLVQDADALVADPAAWTRAAGPAPSAAVLATAAFAWTAAKHLRSNAIAIADDLRLVGAGSGQVDRLAACRHAVEKSAGRIGPGSVAASDAFFPFPDGPSLLVEAGVRCLVHPGGSRRDADTFSMCEARGVTCLVTGVRHFRH